MRLTELHAPSDKPLDLRSVVHYYTAQGRHDDLKKKLQSEWGGPRL